MADNTAAAMAAYMQNLQYRAVNAPETLTPAEQGYAQSYTSALDAQRDSLKQAIAFSQSRNDNQPPSAEFQRITNEYANRYGVTSSGGYRYVQPLSEFEQKYGTTNPYPSNSAAGIAWEIAKTGGASDLRLNAIAYNEITAPGGFGGNPNFIRYATDIYQERPSFGAQTLVTREGQTFYNPAWSGVPIRMNMTLEEAMAGGGIKSETGKFYQYNPETYMLNKINTPVQIGVDTGIHTRYGDFGGPILQPDGSYGGWRPEGRLVGGKTIAGEATLTQNELPMPFRSTIAPAAEPAQGGLTNLFIKAPQIATGAVAAGIDSVTGFVGWTPMKDMSRRESPEISSYLTARDSAQSEVRSLQQQGIEQYGTDALGRIVVPDTQEGLAFKSKYETAISKAESIEDKAKREGVLKLNYGVGTYEINPEYTTDYGEFSKWSRGAGSMVRETLGFTQPQLEQYAAQISKKEGLSPLDYALAATPFGVGFVSPEKVQATGERIVYGTGYTLSTDPGQFVSGAIGGAGLVLGGEAIGMAGIGARAAPILAQYPRTAAALGFLKDVGIPAGMAGLTYYSATEGLTASPERAEINVGKMTPMLAGFYYGGVAVSPGALSIAENYLPRIEQRTLPYQQQVVVPAGPTAMARKSYTIELPTEAELKGRKQGYDIAERRMLEVYGTTEPNFYAEAAKRYTPIPPAELPRPIKPEVTYAEKIGKGYEPGVLTIDLTRATLIEPRLATAPPREVRAGKTASEIPTFDVSELKAPEFRLAETLGFEEQITPSIRKAMPVVSEGFIPLRVEEINPFGSSSKPYKPFIEGLPQPEVSKVTTTGGMSMNAPRVMEQVMTLDLTGLRTPREQSQIAAAMRASARRGERLTGRELAMQANQRIAGQRAFIQSQLPGVYETKIPGYTRVVKPSVFERTKPMQVDMLREALGKRASVKFEIYPETRTRGAIEQRMIAAQARSTMMQEMVGLDTSVRSRAAAKTSQSNIAQNLLGTLGLRGISERVSTREATRTVNERIAAQRNIEQNILGDIRGVERAPAREPTRDIYTNVIGDIITGNPERPYTPPGTKGITTPPPPIPILSGDFRSSGAGGGGGGRLSGFLFKEVLPVKTARQVIGTRDTGVSLARGIKKLNKRTRLI